MDVENRRANGRGYLGDIAPGPDEGLPADQLGAGDGLTIPIAQQTSNGDNATGGYATNDGAPPNDGTGPGAFPPEPWPPPETTKAFPEAAPPSRGPGKWLRGLTGVDEKLLDRVWEERPRYTCLGAIVLGTATMAALSMLDALDQIFGLVSPGLVLVALFWGALICWIDRFLIASTHGARSRRWLIFVPRIVLAVMFGAIIATPLMLTVFGSAVVSQAQNDQSNALLTYESKLKLCNPLPDQPAKAAAAAQSPGCAQFYVPVSNPAIGTSKAIASEQAQRDQLSAVITADNNQIAALDTIARDECNGVSGSGFSGIVGVGPNCDRDRQKADSFASTSDVAKLQSEVTSLDNKIAKQTLTAGQQTQAYASNVSNAVASLVTTKKQQEGRIGLLNRIYALGELASAHGVIAVATFLLAIFIITVDCLPVLSKMMSGTTPYDNIQELRRRSAERMASESMKVAERQATSRDEKELHRLESDVRAAHELIDEESRFDRAKRDAELDRQIAHLAAAYRSSADMEGSVAS